MGYILVYAFGLFTGILAVGIGKVAKRGDKFICADNKPKE